MRRLLLFALFPTVVAAQADPFVFLDKDKDGKLAEAEVPEHVRPRFRSYDADKDGFVTRKEFEKAASASPDGAAAPTEFLLKDIDYVGKGNPRQTLDLLIPPARAEGKRPLVVFIHGGGWRAGRKEDGLGVIRTISAGGYVTASINYRLTPEAAWPAQIHDCKAAIRFLRGNAAKYGIDPERIGVIGISAGGHLVSMLGTSGGVRALEGELGAFPGTSSRVQCVVNFFGPTNFLSFYGKNTTPARIRDADMIGPLLGREEGVVQANAKAASPVSWISEDDAPFLTAHGTKDRLVPYAQAQEIDGALAQAGVESHLIEMTGAGHGFDSPDLNRRIKLFLDKHLYGRPAEIPEDPIRVQ